MAPDGRKAAEGEEGSARPPAAPGPALAARTCRAQAGSHGTGWRSPGDTGLLWGRATHVGGLVPGTGKRSIPPGHFGSTGIYGALNQRHGGVTDLLRQ